MARRKTRLTAAALCAVLPAALSLGPAQAAAGTGRTTLTGTDVAPVRSGSTDEGPASTNEQLSIRIYLNVNDPQALAAAAKAASDPNSPDYARYEPAAQIRDRYQLDQAQLTLVDSWLESAGLTVGQQTNWRELAVSGTLGQLESAFDVQYDDYSLSIDGVTLSGFLVDSALSVPDDVASLVMGVGGATYSVTESGSPSAAERNSAVADSLDSAASQVTDPDGQPLDAPAPKSDPIAGENRSSDTAKDDATDSSTDNPQCSQYWGQDPATGVPKVDGATPPYVDCGYTPAQLRKAYGVDDSALTGKGQTVAVISPPSTTLEQDVDTWSAQVGAPALTPGQLKIIPSPDGSVQPVSTPNGGTLENTLDVEAVHAMAPAANIVSIGLSGEPGTNVMESLDYIEDHDLASIVSGSLGEGGDPPGMQAAYDQVFQEGALQGIGFYFATGDDGAYSYPASSSWATGVGGTALAIGANGRRLWETGWGDAAENPSADGTQWVGPEFDDGGAGGGRVDGQPQPWYQHGVVPDSLAEAPDGQLDRVGADVAMDAADVTGMLVGGHPYSSDGSQYATTPIGGTSMSTPLFAAVQALAQQTAGHRLGFANPEIYDRYATSSFHDVTAYKTPGGNFPTTVYPADPAGGYPTPTLAILQAQIPADPTNLPDPPQTLPGFDEVTGVGAPTIDYIRSFANTGRADSR